MNAGTPTTPPTTPPVIPNAVDVRPLPVPKSLRDSIMVTLNELPENSAAVEVERADGTTKIAAMVKLKKGWSFMGWVQRGEEYNAVGARVVKTFGGG